ncbi:Transposase [uncultured Butyricicoccus sp.]|uniref:IS110 family transposase n=1 Tax=Agathobaculum ammoniilyticum TaxID=2981778 RepID=A0ABT2U4Q8_9FIRM|nr:transposase [Agathobaculum ammoniilyticum]MCU6789550.1 IS110 family transposase [Agathobaculum ammoniilyticum]SCJ26188.1 Transposase [uncultured Butyricicoccus sp.]
MMNQTITTVGIDVSKGKRAVAVRRADRKIVLPPVQIDHTADGVSRLVEQLREIGGDMRIVMERTRMYWRPIAHMLRAAGYFVSVVNAIRIHNFSNNSLQKMKTDKTDTLKIANYGLAFWTDLRNFSDEDETIQMLKMQCLLYERTQETSVELQNGLISLLGQTFPPQRSVT